MTMNKKIKLTSLFLLLGLCFFTGIKTARAAKDPVRIEVILNKNSVEEALQTAKAVLLENKFVATNGIQQTGFTATRTTAAKADYYVADVQATQTEAGIKVSITFIKAGTGLMNLKKTAEQVKKSLEEK
jgi:hypothetical protein